jgi:hypothetical protein
VGQFWRYDQGIHFAKSSLTMFGFPLSTEQKIINVVID